MEGEALLRLAAFCVFIACVHGTSAPLLLTDEDFARQTRDSDTLVLFFAPWCGHCLRLLPTWDVVAAKVHTTGRAKVAKVDCTVDSELCTKFNVMGYPTVILVSKDGTKHAFQAERTQDALIDFVLSNAQGGAARQTAV